MPESTLHTDIGIPIVLIVVIAWRQTAERPIAFAVTSHPDSAARASSRWLRDPLSGLSDEPPWEANPDLRITSASCIDDTVHTGSIRARPEAHGAHRVPR